MAYSPELAEFLYKSCYDAIQKYKEGGEDGEKLMQLTSWLASFRQAGYVSDSQISALTEELGVDVEVPDAANSFAEEIASLGETVAAHEAAVASIDSISETVAIHDDAIAELSEIVAAEEVSNG